MAPTPLPRWGSWSDGMTSIGQVLGLVGMALMAINLLLSARLRFWERYFNGLNKVYEKHSQIGQAALMMMLFHPLMLIPRYAGGSFHGALLFLLPSSNWPQNWGILALGLMIGLLVLTLYLKPRYDIWKWTHKFLGGAFFLAALHMVLIPSDTSRFGLLRWYMLGLAGAGLLAFIYKTLLGRWLVNRYRYGVAEVVRLNDEVVEVTMVPKGERLKFVPGQFVFVSFKDEQVGEESHPFSISSGKDEENLRVTIKRLGDYTKRLENLRPGTEVEIEGPYGRFSFALVKEKQQIWIAGGIGVTPFLSMARSLKDDQGYEIDLYYCTRNDAEAMHLRELESLAGELRVLPYYSAERGHVTVEAIEQLSAGLKDKAIFICAPVKMIKSIREQLVNRGVDNELIYSEEFEL